MTTYGFHIVVSEAERVAMREALHLLLAECARESKDVPSPAEYWAKRALATVNESFEQTAVATAQIRNALR